MENIPALRAIGGPGMAGLIPGRAGASGMAPGLDGLVPGPGARGGANGVISQIIPESEMARLRPLDEAMAGRTYGPPATGGALPDPIPAFGSGRDTFAETLGGLVREVGAKQADAGDAVRGLITNQGVSLHQAMIAMEEASVSFQLMVEVRNKLLEGYQELMRMQV
jgi:flagellar hook-basal body complex protein FliE